jgi:hypothetical protein
MLTATFPQAVMSNVTQQHIQICGFGCFSPAAAAEWACPAMWISFPFKYV